jgi:ankyrin repeat protein
MSWLIEEGGVDVNQFSGRMSAVHTAALYGNVQALELLSEKGADLLLEGGRSSSPPVIQASRSGSVSAVKFFLKNAYNGDAKKMLRVRCRKHGESILHYAAKEGRNELLRWILKLFPKLVDLRAGNSSGTTALMMAASSGKAETVRMLATEFGAGVRKKEFEHGATAAHFAASKGHFHILTVISDIDRSAMDVLDNYGGTPKKIELARMRGHGMPTRGGRGD